MRSYTGSWSTSVRGDVVIVALEGTFVGGDETKRLEAMFRGMVQNGPKKILVDLGGVTHLNSLVMGILTVLGMKVQREGGALVLCRPPTTLKTLLTTRCFPRPFQEFDRCEEAYKALEANPK